MCFCVWRLCVCVFDGGEVTCLMDMMCVCTYVSDVRHADDCIAQHRGNKDLSINKYKSENETCDKEFDGSIVVGRAARGYNVFESQLSLRNLTPIAIGWARDRFHIWMATADTQTHITCAKPTRERPRVVHLCVCVRAAMCAVCVRSKRVHRRRCVAPATMNLPHSTKYANPAERHRLWRSPPPHPPETGARDADQIATARLGARAAATVLCAAMNEDRFEWARVLTHFVICFVFVAVLHSSCNKSAMQHMDLKKYMWILLAGEKRHNDEQICIYKILNVCGICM